MANQNSHDPVNWAALVDFAPELGYADWRDEVLSFLLYPAEPRPAQPVVTRLRRAV
jgi:hypothetical protein